MIEAAARRYADWWQGLTPGRIAELDALVAPSVRFRDPFNDVVGIEAMRRVLEKMFEDVPDAAFTITDVAIGGAVYLRWRFQGGRFAADGVTELAFDAGGRVVCHVDHWDSGTEVYAKLPLVGALVRLIRRRLAAAG